MIGGVARLGGLPGLPGGVTQSARVALCGSRKYPYTHGWFFSFYSHALGISLPESHLWTPPTPQEFPFFNGGGSFLKLTAFLRLNKSENTSFITTQP